MGKVQKVKNTASKACSSAKTNGWAGKVRKAIGKKPSITAAKKAGKVAAKDAAQADMALQEDAPKVRSCRDRRASMICGREVKPSTILLTGSGPLFVSQVEISPAATVGMARKAQKKAEKRAAKKEKKRANSFESIRYQRQAQKAMDEL